MLKNLLSQISLIHKIAGFFLIISISIITYAKINSSNEAFSQAKDFPEGALVYAQFQDLPALYKIWDESELKQKYLESVNFNEFENKHLAMKLVSRLNEFEAASNFPLDISAILSSSETKAAIAVYDIGRLDFVFIAPLSEEKILASQFFLNKSAFEENTLEDGTRFYGKNVESDRGRQRQKMLFAALNGRFILATDEVKFFKTIAIINKKGREKNLFDAPEFRNLSSKIEPHQAAIWVDQRKLNEDWYFKHYWAFKNKENLSKIRAGIFDFEIQENNVFERRKFLLNSKSEETAKISVNEINDLQKFIPENIPHFKFQTINNSTNLGANEIRKTLLDGFSRIQETDKNSDSSDYYSEYNYQYAGNFETEINENTEDFQISESDLRDETAVINELNQILAAANPKISASISSPQSLPMPLFFENRRAVIFSLQNPKNLNREKLENVLANLAANQITIAKHKINLNWETTEENGKISRELKMPSLGWKFIYSVQNNKLIFTNNTDLFNSMLAEKEVSKIEDIESFNEFTTLRFNLHNQAFDSIMSKIKAEESKNAENESVDFFVDNVGSLFEVLANVNRVEIKRNYSGNYLNEEINFVLEQKDE